jgi:serine phosphatase RsbU (regulator of sigma subunit)
MSSAATLDDLKQLQSRKQGRKTDPLRPAAGRFGRSPDRASSSTEGLPLDAAIVRQSSQLPAFAPLLEELEIAGWSSHRAQLSGNFHDWLLLDRRTILVAVGQAVGATAADSTEAALVAQAAWASIRAHARHVHDAGMLLSLTAETLWPLPNSTVHAHVAVALIDTPEGHATIAIAGDALVWKIRAATSEQLASNQPPLGAATHFTYLDNTVNLSLRERLILVADNPHHRPPKLPTSIAVTFAHQSAETHRRMLAADAVALVRKRYEHGPEELRSPASIAAVRRR